MLGGLADSILATEFTPGTFECFDSKMLVNFNISQLMHIRCKCLILTPQCLLHVNKMGDLIVSYLAPVSTS